MKAKIKPFHFKQFIVHQDLSAMKVGTDGVLLGAWTDTANALSILDIGCGTGLISLMLAQRAPKAFITAIDIEKQAILQAKQNFNDSKWSEQLLLFHSSLQSFDSESKFDLIVSNPPFFKAESIGTPREIARNQAALSFPTLSKKAKELLTPKGRLALVLPFDQMNEIEETTQNQGLFINKVTKVKGNLSSPIKRVLLEISLIEQKRSIDELVIELDRRHQYSLEYQTLLKDYLTIF